jgi:hypothetical protein
MYRVTVVKIADILIGVLIALVSGMVFPWWVGALAFLLGTTVAAGAKGAALRNALKGDSLADQNEFEHSLVEENEWYYYYHRLHHDDKHKD